MRTLLGLMSHWMGSAYWAAVALQWMPVSSGHASASTLVFPPGLADLVGVPAGTWGLAGPQIVAAGCAGAALAPFLWRAVRRWSHRSMWPRAVAALIGVTYACVTLVATVVVILPIVFVAGRAPTQSVGLALVEGLALSVLGAPLIALSMALVVSPVLLVGGAGTGLLAHAVIRRPELSV